MKYGKKARVLGLDGGGTKTIAAVATLDGRVLGVGRALSANFQGVGRRAATLEIKNAVTEALEKSKTRPEDVVAAGYGIAGADRDKDFDIVAEMIVEAGPPCPFVLCNDTTLALRAGTRDGVGVATVAGTGANTMGFNKEGAHVKVGGMDFCGDSGSSYMIVQEALVAAMRAWDGRGPKTILSDIFCETFGLEEIADIIEKTFFDSYEHLRLNKYAPLVFDAARRGDRMALNVLRRAGRAMGNDTLSCLRRLFPDRVAKVPVVLGGSVYQKARHSAMIDELHKVIRRVYPNVRFRLLKVEPCVGGLLLALDEAYGKTTPAAVQKKPPPRSPTLRH